MKLQIYNNTKPIEIKPLDRDIHWNMKTEKTEETVRSFLLTNDNFQNCQNHEKCLNAAEMLAIYEYMKKVMEET